MRGRTTTAATLALVFGIACYIGRAEEEEQTSDGGNGGSSNSNSDSSSHDAGSGDQRFHYEYGPCAYQTPEQCLEADTVFRENTQRRIECAWFVPTRDYEVCYQNDNGERECQDEQQDQSGCGYCYDIYGDGYEYADYTCSEIRSQLKKNGRNRETNIYCRDDVDNEVPEFASYYCANLTVMPHDRVKCIDTVCEEELNECENDTSEDGCKDLIDKLNEEVDKWENCTANNWDGNADDDWDANREDCRECPGRFREGDDYFECDELYPYYASQYCADDEELAEQYSDACDKLKPLSLCNTNCDVDYCEAECSSQFNECHFTAGCYGQLKEFESRIETEQEESDSRDDLDSDPFGRYLVKNVYEEYCDELQSDNDQEDCTDEFEAVYNCARPACLADRCLTQGDCDSLWETCYNDDECMTAFNQTLCAVNGCGGDDDDDDSGSDSDSSDDSDETTDEPLRRRLLNHNECCECCANDNDCDGCDQDSFDCNSCSSGDGSSQDQIQDNHSESSDGGDDGDDNEPEMIFLITNYMKWYYTYQCQSNCDNSDFEAVLNCVNEEDSACADEFERSDVCIGSCREAMQTCFADETCGEEFDTYWKHEQQCGDSSDFDSSDEDNSDDDCNAWRYNDDGDLVYGEGMNYQQYQCFEGDGCSDEYRALWVCLTPCFFAERYDEEYEECKYYSDNDCDDDDDGPIDDECLVDCDEAIADCMYDEDCYYAVSAFFDNGTLLEQWLVGELQEGNSLTEESFDLFLEEEFCSQDGITCNDKFDAVTDCLWEECIYDAIPCYMRDCYSYMYDCLQDEDCRDNAEQYFQWKRDQDGSVSDSNDNSEENDNNESNQDSQEENSDDNDNDNDDNNDNNDNNDDNDDNTDDDDDENSEEEEEDNDADDTDDDDDTTDGGNSDGDDTTDGGSDNDGSDTDENSDGDSDATRRRLLEDEETDENTEENNEENNDENNDENTEESEENNEENNEENEESNESSNEDNNQSEEEENNEESNDENNESSNEESNDEQATSEESSSSVDVGELFDLPIPDYEGEGTQEDRDEWTSEVYQEGCGGDSSECSELFVNMIECFADACIYDTDFENNGSQGDDASVVSTLLSVILALIAALVIA